MPALRGCRAAHAFGVQRYPHRPGGFLLSVPLSCAWPWPSSLAGPVPSLMSGPAQTPTPSLLRAGAVPMPPAELGVSFWWLQPEAAKVSTQFQFGAPAPAAESRG